jgi:hypothetical protein
MYLIDDPRASNQRDNPSTSSFDATDALRYAAGTWSSLSSDILALIWSFHNIRERLTQLPLVSYQISTTPFFVVS